MEPPKPAKRADVLRKAPCAAPGDYDEYERLLAKRFTKEPQGNLGIAAAPDQDEARLKELTKKLFGV